MNVFYRFYLAPRNGGEVSNIGGSRFIFCSMLDAIASREEIAGKRLDWTYVDRSMRSMCPVGPNRSLGGKRAERSVELAALRP